MMETVYFKNLGNRASIPVTKGCHIMCTIACSKSYGDNYINANMPSRLFGVHASTVRQAYICR